MKLWLRFLDWLHQATGREWGGTPSPPPDMLTATVDGGAGPDYGVMVREDGFSIGISYEESGTEIHSFRADAFHNLVTWYVWEYWVKGTWCGLKRRLHYWALSKRLEARREVDA